MLLPSYYTSRIKKFWNYFFTSFLQNIKKRFYYQHNLNLNYVYDLLLFLKKYIFFNRFLRKYFNVNSYKKRFIYFKNKLLAGSREAGLNKVKVDGAVKKENYSFYLNWMKAEKRKVRTWLNRQRSFHKNKIGKELKDKKLARMVQQGKFTKNANRRLLIVEKRSSKAIPKGYFISSVK